MRYFADRTFTILTYASVGFMALLLVVILVPMIWTGSSAVFFYGTVEFRQMQHELEIFDRGNPVTIEQELAQVEPYREHIYEQIESFRNGLDVDQIRSRLRLINREYGKQLRFENVEIEKYQSLKKLSMEIRDILSDAFRSFDQEQIDSTVAEVLKYESNPDLNNYVAAEYFTIARNFREASRGIDLTRLESYKASLEEVEILLTELFGPRPGEPEPELDMNKYGATRWDKARSILERIEYKEVWVAQGPGLPNVKKQVPRRDDFTGTSLEPLFDYIEANAENALMPRFTFYWQYFIDDSTHGHYFGGVGPEILGTLLLTGVGMFFVIPVGIITAAYLVECTSENIVVRMIRMCINTLAGVPSIVFGLFGLAFFVTTLLPMLGQEPTKCVLTASLTLAILTLPVMIRASEEAIRAVPRTYKEASLGLGASRFRTFVRVTLPAALPGILTGIILSLSRIAGETAPILFTGAVAAGSIPDSLLEPTRTLSYGSWHMAVGDRLAPQVPHNQYGMVVTLILLILLMNAISIVLRSRLFKKLKGT